jgi:two-component sensor histidine kinase
MASPSGLAEGKTVKGWWRRFADRRIELGLPGSIALAVICVVLATVVRITVGWLFGPTLSFATYFPAVLGAALYGGVWAGLLSITLSIIIVWWAFMPPEFVLQPLTAQELANIALFAFSSLLVVWLAIVHRRLVIKLEEKENLRALLVGEVQHRSKNILAVVDLLVRQTIEDKDASATLIKRIHAIANTQDLLDASDQRTLDLRTLLLEELSQPYAIRIKLEGPSVQLSASLARALRLVFHEMATNALKHGALSEPAGKVSVDWTADYQSVTINWCEMDGPKVSAPRSHNFGSKLIVRTLKQLDAKFEPTFAESGYCYRLKIPLAA